MFNKNHWTRKSKTCRKIQIFLRTRGGMIGIKGLPRYTLEHLLMIFVLKLHVICKHHWHYVVLIHACVNIIVPVMRWWLRIKVAYNVLQWIFFFNEGTEVHFVQLICKHPRIKATLFRLIFKPVKIMVACSSGDLWLFIYFKIQFYIIDEQANKQNDKSYI